MLFDLYFKWYNVLKSVDKLEMANRIWVYQSVILNVWTEFNEGTVL